MLTDEGKPNPSERAAVAAYIMKLQDCVSEGAVWRTVSYGESVAAIGEAAFDQSLLLAAELYGGQLTFGEYNQRRFALACDTQSRPRKSEHGLKWNGCSDGRG
jgi:hypothetical protein